MQLATAVATPNAVRALRRGRRWMFEIGILKNRTSLSRLPPVRQPVRR
jgi:hypothetical protein